MGFARMSSSIVAPLLRGMRVPGCLQAHGSRWLRSSQSMLFAVIVLTGLSAVAPRPALALPATKVFLNGSPAPVYFNDGDSFRVLGGPLEGTKARLAGFNTLESYGAVHHWGTWTPHELYRNAKLGTLNARRGVWHCTSDMSRDGYGRILWWCPDLAVDQVRKGLAHVMTVTSSGGDPLVVRAQELAIKERRGMWAHGVPDFVLTSTHSNNEGYEGTTYNRLISTKDGHSEKMLHKDNYAECFVVCSKRDVYDDAAIGAAVVDLAAAPELAAFVGRYRPAQLRDLIKAKLKGEALGGLLDEAHRAPLEAALTQRSASGALGVFRQVRDSCMTYAPFTRRYGARSASCLH
jgi:endonuclease YncB( thermonuclease family)